MNSFIIHGFVHHNNILLYKSQQDAHVTEFILSDNCSTCFGRHQHPSSGCKNESRNMKLSLSSNLLKTKRRLLYLKTHSVPRSKYFSSRLQKPISYVVWGTSRCLFSHKYKAHKYSVGRAYSCWMLNCWCIT